MHPAWQLEDIRYLVFQHLEPQDLVRLAQTCHALFETATDEIWKSAKSFSLLLRLLPPDVRDRPTNLRRRPLRIADIDRFNFYAAKIKNMCLENKDRGETIGYFSDFPGRSDVRRILIMKERARLQEGIKFWRSIWKEIAELRPAADLLPNLQHLRIECVSEGLLIPLIGISGLNLIHIYIKTINDPEPESVVRKILEQLHGTPKLEYLFVKDGEHIVPTKLLREAPLKNFRFDQKIFFIKGKIVHLPPELFGMSTLEHLTLGLTRDWYTPELDKYLERKYLPALKSLWLNLVNIMPQICDICRTNKDILSCTCQNTQSDRLRDEESAQEKKCPTSFLIGLDNPELHLLRINFPREADADILLHIVSAAKESCQLKYLNELALTGGNSMKGPPGGRHRHSSWYRGSEEIFPGDPKFLPPDPPTGTIQPRELRNALKILLPLPHLRTLQLSVAPNFLDILDLELYKSITDGLPALRTLSLGHANSTADEQTPLHHLAIFCSMLPSLRAIEFSTMDCRQLWTTHFTDRVCPSVKLITIGQWSRTQRGLSVNQKEYLEIGLKTYFPNAELDKKERENGRVIDF